MRHAPAIAIVLPLLAACARVERGPTVTITQRLPVPWLADSVAGPPPAGVAARLVPDSASPPSRAEVGSTVARDYCAPALRDPASGQRFVATRTQVSTQTLHPGRDTTIHELRGWGDYRPIAPAAIGMAEGQALRVDCATHEVRGMAPGVVGA